MPDTSAAPRLLVFDCHEAWVHQLEGSGFELDVVVGLAGRHVRGWDERMRPVPRGARLVTLPEARARAAGYACVVAHNVSDLLDARDLDLPKVLVLHGTVEARLDAEGSAVTADQARGLVGRYLELVGGLPVAVSALKARSWGLGAEVVPNGVDVAAYPRTDGSLRAGVRVCNHFQRRREVLRADLHEAAFDGLPVTLIGHNPELPGVEAARGWDDLKRQLARHRFCVHTADPRYEDGFNMGLFEAMAAGLPVLGNPHPTSPVEHGVSGYLAEDPAELRARAVELLDDPERALAMGRAAREAVARRFPLSAFHAGIARAVEAARARHAAQAVSSARSLL